jgi:hypothetical protein
MEEVAPEYDVIVMGTGTNTAPPRPDDDEEVEVLTSGRPDGMCVVWVRIKHVKKTTDLSD